MRSEKDVTIIWTKWPHKMTIEQTSSCIQSYDGTTEKEEGGG